MITKVSLQNWRSHEKTAIEFGPGTNVLIGKMGSGKSSVMNAICFALFGTFPDLQTRKIKLDDAIMSRPSQKEESHIVVSFIADGKEYTVTRILEKGSGTTYSEIREGNTLIDSPNAQRVTEIVEEKLKIDYETFSRVIYSEQNGLDYFLRLPRGDRMKKIDNLLLIDRFETARANVVTLQNKIADRKAEKQSIVGKFDEEEVKTSLNDLKYSIEKLNDTMKTLSKELGEKVKKRAEVAKRVDELDLIERRLNSLLQEKKSVEGAMEENKALIKDIKKAMKDFDRGKSESELKGIEKEMELLKAALKKDREEFNRINSELSRSKAESSHLYNETKKLESEISEKEKFIHEIRELEKILSPDPEKRLAEKRDELSNYIKLISEKSSRLEQAEKSLSEISHLKDECPTCHSKISEPKKKKLIEMFSGEVSSFERDTKGLEISRLETERMLAEVETKARRWRLLSEKTSDLDSKKNDLKQKKELLVKNQKNLRTLEAGLPKIDTTLKANESRFEALSSKRKEMEFLSERFDELKDKESRVEDLAKKLSGLEKDIASASAKIKGEKISEARKELQSLVSREAELSSRVESLDELIDEKRKRFAELEEQAKLIERQRSEIAELETLIRETKKFETALQRTQVQLRERFIKSINRTMNEIWPDMYPYRDYTGARLHIKDRDYVLQLETRGGEWIDVDGVASGGERSIASLVLRVAFSIVLAPQLKVLVLDEPTANLDSRAIDDLANTLRDSVGGFLNQVFIVTHEKRLENAVTGFMYSFDRNKEIDEPTRIEAVN